MYCLLFLIVLVSLDGSGANDNTSTNTQNLTSETSNRTTILYTIPPTTTKTTTRAATQTTSVNMPKACSDKPTASFEETCLFNIKTSKDMMFLLVIAVFSLFCLLLLIITLILLCKRRRRVRISSQVTNAQFNPINSNNVDGGPSETVHIINDNPETAEAEREEQEPQEVGGETAEANHTSTEGTDTPAPEATPTPEPDIAPPKELELPPPPEPEISGELV